ncbi:hypothetical protein M9H77_18861 [Catharanthus roseus]|uniref:Uncharacterized protein n=1 Tax=Catharanthus roseus TaxID=4058 RepID=A0ACC0B8W8_CATRO|nr:hypothetical protein M9H77_18861 [Catharanthus roseus]
MGLEEYKKRRRHSRTGCRGVVAKFLAITPVGLDQILELKANAERLHVETGSHILTDKQLMFEAADGSNKGHIYGFGLQSTTITAKRRGGSSSSMSLIPLISSVAGHEPISRGKGGYGDTCNKHMRSSPTS